MAAESGLLTLAAYLWMMWVVLRFAWRGYRRTAHQQESTADLYLGVFLAVACFNVAGFFEANWRDTEVQRLVLFLLAIPWCLEEEASPSPARRAET